MNQRLSLLLLVLCSITSLGAKAQDYENVAYSENDDSPRFVEEEHHLIHPILTQSSSSSSSSASSLIPLPSIPEPLAAQEPKKSLFEEIGIKSSASSSSSQLLETSAAASTKVHVENDYSTQSGGGDDDKDKQLKDALQTVKDEIVAKASQIKSEKKWVKEVTKIVQSYVAKTQRVNANIRSLQKEVKDLFRKKKQVENLMVQRRLSQKLSVASKDMSTLETALQNVQKKEKAFSKSKEDITHAINVMQDELKKLRGEAASGNSTASL